MFLVRALKFSRSSSLTCSSDVNQRFVTNTPLHKLIATRFADTLEAGTSSLEAAQELSLAQGSKRSKRLPSYILNLDCPCSEYDITFEPTKSYVEFKVRIWNRLSSLWPRTNPALVKIWFLNEGRLTLCKGVDTSKRKLFPTCRIGVSSSLSSRTPWTRCGEQQASLWLVSPRSQWLLGHAFIYTVHTSSNRKR